MGNIALYIVRLKITNEFFAKVTSGATFEKLNATIVACFLVICIDTKFIATPCLDTIRPSATCNTVTFIVTRIYFFDFIIFYTNSKPSQTQGNDMLYLLSKLSATFDRILYIAFEK